MNRTKNLPVFVLATSALLLCGTLLNAASVRYSIEQIPLADGYEISDGFIETDGTFGLLSPSNITSYSVTMSGPVGYVFSSDTASVIMQGDVYADANSIWVGLGNGLNSSLQLSTNDNTVAGCDDCHQDIYWFNQPTTDRSLVAYDHHDHFDDMPDSGFKSFVLGTPQAPITVATVVPEPGAFSVAFLAMLFLAKFARKRR